MFVQNYENQANNYNLIFRRSLKDNNLSIADFEILR